MRKGGEMPRQEHSPKWGRTDRKDVAISWAGFISAFTVWRGGTDPLFRFKV